MTAPPANMAAQAGYPGQAPSAGAQPQGAGAFHCSACNETFATAEELRAHCKSERHVYNTKRRLAGLKPISQEIWERKLRESQSVAEDSRGKSHLKSGKAKEPRGKGLQWSGLQKDDHALQKEEEPWTPECSLFDRKRFGTIDESLEYMWKTYNFAVPDREYCTDLSGLLGFLHDKIEEGICIYCNRKFPDGASCRRHMLDQKHTRVGTQALSRRGRKDDLGSEEMQDELQDFFDFTGSTREVTERIVKPEQKVASLLRFFDTDRDGFLDFQELGKLWCATNDGAELSETQYVGACSMAGADPEDGLGADALGKLYAGGLADLGAHFAVLQELLMHKLTSRRKKRSKKNIIEEDETEVEEEDGDEAEEGDDDEDEEDDDSEGSGSDSDVVLECDDEDEFKEVMRVLGLQPATLMDNGDLRLPNGHVAVHREVSHIWKQRGTRIGQLALPGGGLPGKQKTRNRLALTNSAVCMVAMSHREQVREGKRVIAVMRKQERHIFELGMRQNVLQKKKPQKFRTVCGDMSGGR